MAHRSNILETALQDGKQRTHTESVYRISFTVHSITLLYHFTEHMPCKRVTNHQLPSSLALYFHILHRRDMHAVLWHQALVFIGQHKLIQGRSL
jgi:hypothetical protein